MYLRKIVPSVRNESKPNVSVHIVRKLTEPRAGSNRISFKNKGIKVPRKAATKRLMIIDRPKMRPRKGFPMIK